MRRNAFIPLVLGLGIGLLAVKFVVQSIRTAQASSQARQVVTAVRAKQDIGAYDEIAKESVELVETADNVFAPANERIEKLDNAIGRVTSKPIPKNSPILLSMLAPPGTKSGITGRIPPGFRAVAVKIDEASSVAYQIQTGAWVDVIVVMDMETASQGKKETIAEVILQHVQVAAIGHDSSPEMETGGKQAKPAKSATLLVAEADVPKLHLAGTRGKITLAMRGEDATVTANPARAYESEILGGTQPVAEAPSVTPPAPQAPSPPPVPRAVPQPQAEPHSMMVYHGSKSVERITFENAHSMKILEVAPGAPMRASAAPGLSNPPSRMRSTPSAAKDPTEPSDEEAQDESKFKPGE